MYMFLFSLQLTMVVNFRSGSAQRTLTPPRSSSVGEPEDPSNGGEPASGGEPSSGHEPASGGEPSNDGEPASVQGTPKKEDPGSTGNNKEGK